MSERALKFLTSLRLTVVLLSAGLLLVFVGTLAQVHEGLYQAQTRYFKSWFVWKPTIGDSAWPVLLPGGYLIGSMLLLNLLAAHATRFKFTKKRIGILMIHATVKPRGQPVIKNVLLEIDCNLGPAGFNTGKPEGVVVTIPSGPTFIPTSPTTGVTVFSLTKGHKH